MVNKDKSTQHNSEQQETDITSEYPEVAAEEQDIEEIESLEENKLKSLRDTINRLEEEKRTAQEELAVAKADFLNAKKRLEEEKRRSVERQKIRDIQALLPLCDSFAMAKSDKEAWEAADERWRRGIEGIEAQLQQILQTHNVESVDPAGKPFDPQHHEAISTEPVDDDQLVDTVVTVLQKGYVIHMGEQTEHIRNARVTIGSKE